MKHIFTNNNACTLLLLIWICSGCNGNSRPETVNVEGRITYNNKPVTMGTIIFQPKHKTDGAVFPATSPISADGKYSMSSFTDGDGVVPGEYEIAIRSTGGSFMSGPEASVTWLVPKKYSSPITSGLTASVSADGPSRQEVNFDLK